MSAPEAAKILLVEDEFLLALQLERALIAAGYEVLGPFATVPQALGALAVQLPAAAVLDVNLVGGTVFEVADALAEEGVPFVFCTGRQAADLPPEHRSAPLLQKPCAPQALLDWLHGRLHAAAD